MSPGVLRRPKPRWAVLLAAVAGLFAVATPAQAWSPYSLQHVMSGKCLDADRNSWYSNGGKVQVWDCNGASNQQWWANWGSEWTPIATPGGADGPSKCLDAWPDGSYTWGFKVSVWDCNGGTQQGWQHTV
ncbi:MAG: RICIN domain-containing protein, partial [Frankia sp.]